MSARETGKDDVVWVLLITLLSTIGVAPAQTAQRDKVLVVTGHTGEAAVIQTRGRDYVDLEMLGKILNGAISHQGSQLVLTLPAPAAGTETQASPAAEGRFSRGFVNAAIETLGSMREWASTLALIIKKGYPVGDLIDEHRGQAMKNFALANTAVQNNADRNGLQLLTNEYNNLQAWSDELVKARNSMSAANYSMSQDALLNDPVSQKILRCWKFLGPMFANGRFEDDGSCR